MGITSLDGLSRASRRMLVGAAIVALPRIVDTAGGKYTELTLNTFRPFANRAPSILSLLTNSICAG
jgi:hypothetical protein